MGPAKANLAITTTSASLVHLAVARSVRTKRQLPLAAIYLAAVAATYGVLMACALLTHAAGYQPVVGPRLSFFADVNVAFMFLVSFPCLLLLTLTDDRALAGSLRRVQVDGTVTIADRMAAALAKRWNERFRRINICAQYCGAALGAVLAYFNYVTYAPASVGFWIADAGRLMPIGYVFLACIFLFYALIPLYVFRSVATTLLLSDLVEHSELRLLPFHPDRAGGLRPVGRLGLRNQYALTVFGLNVLLLFLVSTAYLEAQPLLNGLIYAAAGGYIVLGPLVFMGPLLPFRAGMLRVKSELLGEVAQRLRRELRRLRDQLPEGSISREDEELVDRLRKVGDVVDKLPVWPFDAGTLRKFTAAYVIPALGAVAYPLATQVASFIVRYFQG